jgi:hypothetical protein
MFAVSIVIRFQKRLTSKIVGVFLPLWFAMLYHPQRVRQRSQAALLDPPSQVERHV